MLDKIGLRARGAARGRLMVSAVVGLIVAVLAVACAPTGGNAARSTAGTRLTSEDQVQRIAPAEAKALVDQGKAVLYDVRSEELYNARHAAGAQSLPFAEIEARLAGLPKDKVLILYCT